MSQKINISAVSYLNTKPFIYGLEMSGLKESKINLSLDMPSICAEKFNKQLVDIALMPVAAIQKEKRKNIISDFCIGAVGKVHTVSLFSNVPLNEIKSVLLDYQSKTSVELVKVLAKNHWKIQPNWVKANLGFEKEISGETAAVVIGDRVFDMKGKFHYEYDLSEEWLALTGLPFVFACWVSNEKLDGKFLEEFNRSLQFGVSNIDEALSHFGILTQDNRMYLSRNISYSLDQKKRDGMSLFFEYIDNQ